MDKLKIIQTDRNAAADALVSHFDSIPIEIYKDIIREGKLDDHPWVQNFAAKRIEKFEAVENPNELIEWKKRALLAENALRYYIEKEKITNQNINDFKKNVSDNE